MFRRSPSICPFCEASAISKALRSQPQQCRGAATLQKRRPSRMTLSPNANVAKGPPRSTTSEKTVRHTRNSPFGGMNMTEPPRRSADPRNRISTAEQKRGSRFTKASSSSSEKDKERKDPMRALKMQRALANVSYEKRGRVKQELAEMDSFEQFDLLPTIKESVVSQALGGLIDLSPTPIQRLAIPALLGTEDGRRRKRKQADVSASKEMQQFLLAAETGSGKTLAYVLPIIDAFKRAEKAEQEAERILAAQQQHNDALKKHSQMFELEGPSKDDPHPSTGRPRAIILLPTSELVSQVGALIKNLSHTIKFKSAMISANYTSTVIRNRLFSPGGIDIIISTPHLLNSITTSDPNLLSRVTHLVIDEADSLLDRSFSPLTSAIVDRATPSLQQLILCSATIPRSLDTYLTKRFPAIHRLTTPNLHAIPRRVQLSVVDIDKVPCQGNRDLACAQTIWDIGKENPLEQDEDHDSSSSSSGGGEKKILVFVNEREKAGELATYLSSKGIDATALSRDSDERRQAEILAAFTGAVLPATSQRQQQQRDPSPQTPPNPSPTISPTIRRELKATKALITTDLHSRGIDTLLVKHVILYDVPHTSIDFIHRLGRVGRMGRRGRGVVLVGGKDRRDVVAEVRGGMFRGQALI
ncbi:RNA helicase [Recurvomyces mirabilis]|uniref:RNA helicase n=1 Tax=Recurvomyces mirabilis TaxID=574656 RepID=A0AAE0TQL2_9PEZI|nr:RNA helicase [Recurvomyces mirabilis]KAK5150675.1 RNA helicase [Recurvomyces mirabilis]